MITINWNKYLDFDAHIPPPGMREVIFVKGSPYEMGKQYGEKTKDIIKRNFCFVAGDALKYYSQEQLQDRVELLSKDIESKVPDIYEWYRGIADGSGMTYGEIVLINIQLWVTIMSSMCSQIAATKSATADGNTIAGVNGDITYNMSGYGVTLVAFPDEGNAFVTFPQLCGQMGSNFAMNEKGLIVTFDGGEAELEDDTVFGFADFISAMVYAVSTCNTAEEAESRIKSLGVAGGWIYQFVDADKNIRILEHTSSKDITRVPGDFGEKDYIHASNHFVNEEMRKSSLPVELNLESYTRYDTEEKLLDEGHGELTLESMMQIMATHDWWDGEKWNKEQWGIVESNYSPEMHAPDFRTGTRGFGVAEEAVAYMQHGTTDTAVSFMPESKGQYAKIQLKHTPEDVLLAFEEDAVTAAWQAAEKLALKGDKTKEKLDILDDAKRHIYAGKNYFAKVKLYSLFDEKEALKHYGYAASEFSYAYIISHTI